MIVSKNPQEPGKQWMSKLNDLDRTSCILEDDYNIVVIIMNNSILDRAIYDKTPVTFSFAIDATRVGKLCEVSST